MRALQNGINGIFSTVNLAERKRKVLTEHIGILLDAFRTVKQAHPFQMDAVVVLPDHLHTLWTLPEGDDDFILRWRQIKSAFSRAIEEGERVSLSRAGRQERGIWQRRLLRQAQHRFGNTPSVTRPILRGMWITSTSIR